MSWVWYERSSPYLLGVAGLVLATLGFALGHVAPFWVRVDGDQTQNRILLNSGLWFSCQDGSCFGQSFNAADQDSIKATRILQVLGLLVLVTSVGIAIFANCRRKHPGTSFFLEILIVLGAVLGFSGSMVFLGATKDDVENSSITRYDWAFAVNIAASVLALLSALLIFTANMRAYLHPSDQDSSNARIVAAGQMDDKHSMATTANPEHVYSRTTESFLEPRRDYHSGGDPAVYHVLGSAFPHPLSSLHYPPDRHEEPRMDGFGGAKEWRNAQRKAPPPVPRRSHDDLGRMGVPVEPVRYPVNAIPTRAFILPRVVVPPRGYYDPGYGYPGYTMF